MLIVGGAQPTAALLLPTRRQARRGLRCCLLGPVHLQHPLTSLSLQPPSFLVPPPPFRSPQNGITPLIIAVDNNHYGLLRLLLDSKANPNLPMTVRPIPHPHTMHLDPRVITTPRGVPCAP